MRFIDHEGCFGSSFFGTRHGITKFKAFKSFAPLNGRKQSAPSSTTGNEKKQVIVFIRFSFLIELAAKRKMNRIFSLSL